jgi:hypothetical protein
MAPLARWMSGNMGVPFSCLHDIYDVEEIKTAYDQIGRALGLCFADAFDGQRREALRLRNRAAGRLKGLRYVSAQIGALQPLPLAVFLSDCGASPILVHMEEFYPSDGQWRQRLLDRNEDPAVCAMLNEEADKTLIDGLCPDLILGDWGGRGGSVPDAMTIDLYGQIGYERTISLLTRILGALPERS